MSKKDPPVFSTTPTRSPRRWYGIDLSSNVYPVMAMRHYFIAREGQRRLRDEALAKGKLPEGLGELIASDALALAHAAFELGVNASLDRCVAEAAEDPVGWVTEQLELIEEDEAWQRDAEASIPARGT